MVAGHAFPSPAMQRVEIRHGLRSGDPKVFTFFCAARYLFVLGAAATRLFLDLRAVRWFLRGGLVKDFLQLSDFYSISLRQSTSRRKATRTSTKNATKFGNPAPLRSCVFCRLRGARRATRGKKHKRPEPQEQKRAIREVRGAKATGATKNHKTAKSAPPHAKTSNAARSYLNVYCACSAVPMRYGNCKA